MGSWYQKKEITTRVSERNPGITLHFIVLGAADEDEIDQEVRISTNTPASTCGLSRLDYSAEHQGGNVWFADVDYGVPTANNPALGDVGLSDQTQPELQPPFDGQGDDSQPPDTTDSPSQTMDGNAPLGPEWSFDTKGGTVNVKQAYSHISSTRRGGGNAPDHKGAINVDSKAGTVEGVEVGFGKLRISYTAHFRFLTLNYIKTLKDLTYTVADDTYFGFDGGEPLFVGASGTYQAGQAPWQVVFEFEIGPNLTNISICAGLTVPSKNGHEYLWVEYEDVEDTVAHRMTSRPLAAHVELLYPPTDFKKLGI